MLVSDLTEDDLLSLITPHLPQSPNIVVPTGDDCAVLSVPDGQVAVSTDMLVEDRHFRRQWSTGDDVGWRAAMQNLADAVAMGARPISLVVSLELPGDLDTRWVEEFARGMARACASVGAGVDGGDLVGGDRITISVTVLGALEGRKPRLRSSAQASEALIHAGVLGHGYAGLALLERGYTREGGVLPPPETQLIDDFLRPKPPLYRAIAACESGRVGAFMDVSDGLIRDVRRLARASNVWIDVESERLATDVQVLTDVARRLGFSDPWQWAMDAVLTGGEDHGFVGTLRVTESKAWGLESLGLPEGFRRIGTVRASWDGGRVSVDGHDVSGLGGWDHFAH
ncbi:MAG: thiamine-phosphate kinase [Ancrocorticia sp.]|jgi:thiamine-monophosphate kinase|nr:thiamine-phosphate kinase [Ancrocorticia sp.]MCI2192878.1 thiamine-phosphate kinase [Ancrocorticia sp.]MCI2198894.1 thiamine-phosphate kinase [Ancrocorticia sp.]